MDQVHSRSCGHGRYGQWISDPDNAPLRASIDEETLKHHYAQHLFWCELSTNFPPLNRAETVVRKLVYQGVISRAATYLEELVKLPSPRHSFFVSLIYSYRLLVKRLLYRALYLSKIDVYPPHNPARGQQSVPVCF